MLARANLLTVPYLPPRDWAPEVSDTVSLIDVIWLAPGTGEIVAAFEVEKSTSIYSGILRLEDLVRSIPGCACSLYLVAPDSREKEVMAQLARPSFQNDLAEATTIHWHGLRIPSDQDGNPMVQGPIPAGGSFTYVLRLNDGEGLRCIIPAAFLFASIITFEFITPRQPAWAGARGWPRISQ